jgi:hypothetical protein
MLAPPLKQAIQGAMAARADPSAPLRGLVVIDEVALWAMLPFRLTCRVRPVHCLRFTTSA